MTTVISDSLMVCEAATGYDQDLFTLIGAITGEKKNPEIINRFLESVSLTDWTSVTLQEIQDFGFKPASAQRLLSSLQLVAKFNVMNASKKKSIRSPLDCYNLFKDLAFEKQEHFVVAVLNVKNQVIAKKTIFIGSLNVSIVHPREIFNFAIRQSGAYIIAAHCHPSGNSMPSNEDIEVTRRLEEAGQIVGIELLDHIIIGNNEYTSLKERGYM